MVDTWGVASRPEALADDARVPMFGIPLRDDPPALLRAPDDRAGSDPDAPPTAADERFPYQQLMEQRFGADFSGVEMELGASLSGLGAAGIAQGERVALATTEPSEELVAHELAHVLQYRRHGRGTPGVSAPDDAAEREAEAVAEAVAKGQQAPAVAQRAGVDAERQEQADRESVQPEPLQAQEQPIAGAQRAAPARPDGDEPTATQPEPEPEPAAGTASSEHGEPAAAQPESEPEPEPAAAQPESEPESTTAQPEPAAAMASSEHGEPGTSPAAEPADPARHPEPAPSITLAEPTGLAALTARTASELGPALAEGAARTTALLEEAAAVAAQPRPARAAQVLRAEPRPTDTTAPGAPARPEPEPERARVADIAHAAQPSERPDADAAQPSEHPSAGPRPRVPLTGASAPDAVAADHQARGVRVDARFADMEARAATPIAAGPRRGREQPAPPLRRPTPARVPPVAVTDPFAALAADERELLDRVASDAVARQSQEVAQAAQRIAQDTTTEAAALERTTRAAFAERSAAVQARRAAHTAATRSGLQATQGAWRADNARVRRDFESRAADTRGALEAEMQAEVQAGETRADTILGAGEERAASARQAGQERAQQILAEAERQAAAERAAVGPTMRQEMATIDGGGGGGAALMTLESARRRAQEELIQAEREVQRLLDDAAGLGAEEIAARIDRIQRRVARLRQELDALVENTLDTEFDALDDLYTTQIDALLGELETTLATLESDLGNDEVTIDEDYKASLEQLFERNRERLDDTLTDLEVVSGFDSVDAALDAFGIDMDADEWTGEHRQHALGAAVRLENAWRETDHAGLFDSVGLGEAGALFDAVMVPDGDLALVRTDDREGAIASSDRIEFGSVTSGEHDEGIASGTALHFLHEFHHAFNANVVNATDDPALAPYSGWESGGPGVLRTIAEEDGGLIAADGTVVGIGPDRYVPNQTDVNAWKGTGPDRIRWPAYQERAEAAGGLPISSHTGNLYLAPDDFAAAGYPYQQNMSRTYGEWYADAGANWANGTLPSNPAGQAIDRFYDEQTFEWLTLTLEAQGILPGLPPAPPPGHTGGPY